MFKASLFLIFPIYLGLVSGGGSNLPPYIGQCSLSDPNLDECLVKRANEAIPILAKGDAYFRIPSSSPLVYTEAPIFGNGLKYILFDTYSDDWKNLRVTKMHMDLANNLGYFMAVLDRGELTAQNYTITEGKILDTSASGHGKHNMTLVGVELTYRTSLRLYEKGDEVYLDAFDFTTEISVERGYFYFENIQSPEEDDVNAHIEENWKQFLGQVQPAFESYCNALFSYPIQMTLSQVPFNKMFLP